MLSEAVPTPHPTIIARLGFSGLWASVVGFFNSLHPHFIRFSPPTLTVSHPRCLSVTRSSARPPFGCLSPLFSPSNYLSVFPIINFQERCCSKLELWSKRPQLSDLSYYKLTGTRGNFPSGSAESRFSCSEPGIVEDPDLQGACRPQR